MRGMACRRAHAASGPRGPRRGAWLANRGRRKGICASKNGAPVRPVLHSRSLLRARRCSSLLADADSPGRSNCRRSLLSPRPGGRPGSRRGALRGREQTARPAAPSRAADRVGPGTHDGSGRAGGHRAVPVSRRVALRGRVAALRSGRPLRYSTLRLLARGAGDGVARVRRRSRRGAPPGVLRGQGQLEPRGARCPRPARLRLRHRFGGRARASARGGGRSGGCDLLRGRQVPRRDADGPRSRDPLVQRRVAIRARAARGGGERGGTGGCRSRSGSTRTSIRRPTPTSRPVSRAASSAFR